MTRARRAVTADIPELIRLRAIMLAAVDGHEPEPGPWQEHTADTLRQQLAEPDGWLSAFVVDKPDRPGELAACAVGIIERRLGAPENPRGQVGYVLSVATDPAYRRRGYFRACVLAVLDWCRRRGVPRVDLHASADGEPLYRALGFTPTPTPSMQIVLPPPDEPDGNVPDGDGADGDGAATEIRDTAGARTA